MDFDLTNEETIQLDGQDKAVCPVNSTQFTGVLCLFMMSSLWTIVMTFVPVLFSVPPNYDTHSNWYTGNDVMRLLEPIGGIFFHFFIFKRSGIFDMSTGVCEKRQFSQNCAIIVFLFGIGLYSQGAGFHSASNMFKNSLESVQQKHDDEVVKDLYNWMRNTWEHDVSHYLYATGYALMCGAEAWAYRRHVISSSQIESSTKAVLVAASLSFALLMAGVGVDFPSGIIVVLVYAVVYGLALIGGYIYFHRKNNSTILETLEQMPVLLYFLLSYSFAVILLLIWIAYAGGIYSRSSVM